MPEVAANFLTVLQITPKLGRDFTPEEDTPGGPKVAIISDELWRTRYHGDFRVVGQRIEVGGVPREIVGVLPPGIDHPHACQVYVPLGDLRTQPEINARENKLGWIALGRLKGGVTLAQAQADLDGIAAELARRCIRSPTSTMAFARSRCSTSRWVITKAVWVFCSPG